MIDRVKMRVLLIAIAVLPMLIASMAVTATERLPVYGTKTDAAFAKKLWRELRFRGLIGTNRVVGWPAKGHDPHGTVQQTMASYVKINGRSGKVLVKANHRGEGLTPAKVYEEPNRWLTGFAVMFKREDGYHPPGQDWFWVVYNTDGSVKLFEGKPIAGRIDTGKENGCIGCHKKYGGQDLETLTPR